MEMWVGAENGRTMEIRVKLRKISKITEENTRKGLASMGLLDFMLQIIQIESSILCAAKLIWVKREPSWAYSPSVEVVV